MPEVSELFIYPIKSLRGISVLSAKVTDRGFEFDRRWMLIDSDNNFLSQREFPEMALLQVQLSDESLTVQHTLDKKETARIPLPGESTQTITVQVWSDRCKAQLVSPEVDEWFSDMLSLDCRLVYMPDSSKRRVDTRYASKGEITSLSDGYPFLIIGQSSLDDLNARLQEPLPINRFRPNIVFTGGEPFQEDIMEHFSINDIEFFGVKKCARCVITTINPDNCIKSKEPLKTLSTYRENNNKVYFGQNLLHKGEGKITRGDRIIIHQLKQTN
ncbi:MAG TPA: MOSC N-terminal beta barrel domain-containing protein [Flavitalea sp.]|nr:MOSC N-terminal beta barrel domain-containing protein [Flavitalea sp.]